MADQLKISALSPASLPLDGTEYVVMVQNGVTCKCPVNALNVLASYSKAALPSASVPGSLIYVTNDVGGAVPAFSDGTNWRRVTDRAVIS